MLQRLFHDFGSRHIYEYACEPKSLQLLVSQWFSAPHHDAYCIIWVKSRIRFVLFPSSILMILRNVTQILGFWRIQTAILYRSG